MDIFSRSGRTKPGQKWEFDATEREFLKAMAGLLPAVLPEEEAKFFDKVIDDDAIDLYDMLYPGKLGRLCQAMRLPLSEYIKDIQSHILIGGISDPRQKAIESVLHEASKIKW